MASWGTHDTPCAVTGASGAAYCLPGEGFGARLTECIPPSRMTARSDRSLSENRGVGVLLSVHTLLNSVIITQSRGFVKGILIFFTFFSKKSGELSQHVAREFPCSFETFFEYTLSEKLFKDPYGAFSRKSTVRGAWGGAPRNLPSTCCERRPTIRMVQNRTILL